MEQNRDWYGKLDFTNLCRLWKEHRELFQMVDFKDGKHALLKVNFNERQQPDEHGNTHYLKANCKASEQKEGLNYYISSGFKPSQNQQSHEQTEKEISESELPF